MMLYFMLLFAQSRYDRVTVKNDEMPKDFVASIGAQIVKETSNSSINPRANIRLGYKYKKFVMGLDISLENLSNIVRSGGVYLTYNPTDFLRIQGSFVAVKVPEENTGVMELLFGPTIGVGIRVYSFTKNLDTYLNFIALTVENALAVSVDFPLTISFN